jgi:hypothetical protein
MKTNNNLTRKIKISNIIYGLIVAIFLLDELTSFDIKSQAVKSFIYIGLLVGTPLILVRNYLLLKTRAQKVIGTIFPVTIFILIMIVGPMKFISLPASAWRTQTVLYQNGHLGFKTIEFQMLDVGSFGYSKRTVEVLYLTPFFMIVSEVPSDIDKRAEWIKVDRDVNELGLKF